MPVINISIYLTQEEYRVWIEDRRVLNAMAREKLKEALKQIKK